MTENTVLENVQNTIAQHGYTLEKVAGSNQFKAKHAEWKAKDRYFWLGEDYQVCCEARYADGLREAGLNPAVCSTPSEIPPHVIASIGDILQSLKGGVFTVIPDTVGLYKVTLDTGNVCYYHQANKTLFALGVTYAYLKAAGVNVTLFQDSDITALTATAPPAVTPNAINSQVGGDHYKNMKIQPWHVMRAVMTREEYTAYQIGTVLAYLMRHKAKGGEQDIKKAHHHLTELVEYLNETPKI